MVVESMFWRLSAWVQRGCVSGLCASVPHPHDGGNRGALYSGWGWGWNELGPGQCLQVVHPKHILGCVHTEHKCSWKLETATDSYVIYGRYATWSRHNPSAVRTLGICSLSPQSFLKNTLSIPYPPVGCFSHTQVFRDHFIKSAQVKNKAESLQQNQPMAALLFILMVCWGIIIARDKKGPTL